MSQVILSICIPTYNRAALLKEALESILPQIGEDLRDQVEIVVSDNASTDGTGQLVAERQKNSGRKIKYYRNPANLGFDANVLKVVEQASGEFCWIFGDDDLMAAGALGTVVRELASADGIDLFLGEKRDFLLTPDRPMRFRRIMDFPAGRVFDFRTARGTDEYFRANRKLIAYCNFLSNLVFRRGKWEQVAAKEDYVGSKYVHLYVFQSLLWGGRPGVLKYLPAVLVERRWGNDASYDAAARLAEDVRTYHRIAAAAFSDRRRAWQIDDLVIRNDVFSWAVRLKIKDPGRFRRETLPFLFRAYRGHPLFWFKLAPLALVPGFLLRLMRGAYRRQVKGEPIGLSELWEA